LGTRDFGIEGLFAPKQKKAPPLLTGLSSIRNDAAAYLRVAHMYMLISMPTETSTILGAFQAIWLSL
jgi:hypothetical protein